MDGMQSKASHDPIRGRGDNCHNIRMSIGENRAIILVWAVVVKKCKIYSTLLFCGQKFVEVENVFQIVFVCG